eukprot:scaffold47310_cov43-Cyclotella_meneghiniana.AAC.1
MTTYIVLAGGEELTAVNLHNHFSEEARAKSTSVSSSILDRFFGPGPLAAVKSNVDSNSTSSSSSSSTTTDQHPSFKTLLWIVNQLWYDERWELRTDLINNYSLCGDIDSVSSDLTEEFDLNPDHRENLSSCSSITDTCRYTAPTSTSTESTLDDDIVYPQTTSFSSLSSLSSNSFSDIESKEEKKTKLAKDKVTSTPRDKRKADEKDGGRRCKIAKEVSPTQDVQDESEEENGLDGEDEREKHDSQLNDDDDSDFEKNLEDDSSDDSEEDEEVETTEKRSRRGQKMNVTSHGDSYDIDTVYNSRVMELQAENEILKEQLKQMKQQMTYSLSSKSRKKKDLTREQRQTLFEVGAIMRKTLFRTIKFPILGWDKYSEKGNSCCAKPELPSMLGSRKNDMLQDMRKQHEKDRGTLDYINASHLQEMLNSNTPTEVIKNSGDSRDMFVLFVLHYARYAPPKEQLKEQMRKQVMNAGDSESDHLHMCHLDFLTASDVAFALWQYFNSHDDWERKLDDRTKVYKHDTKWSTDKTGMSMTEGYKVYNELLDWCGKLKEMSKSEASEEDNE